MNLLDIILVIPLLWMAYRGFTRGLIIELATLVALILGIYAAIHFSWFAGELLDQHLTISEKYLTIVSFIITFLIVVMIVIGIGKLIEKVIDFVALGFINRILGFFLGVLKAAFILSALILIIESFDTHDKLITPKAREGSLLYAPVSSVIPKVLSIVGPEKLRPLQDKTKEILALR